MARLPKDHREVLHRRYIRGESLDQIAAATGRSKDGVRGLCFRARKNLRGDGAIVALLQQLIVVARAA